MKIDSEILCKKELIKNFTVKFLKLKAPMSLTALNKKIFLRPSAKLNTFS